MAHDLRAAVAAFIVIQDEYVELASLGPTEALFLAAPKLDRITVCDTVLVRR